MYLLSVGLPNHSTTPSERECGQYDRMDPTTFRTSDHSAKESDEPIFELAEECEALFTKHITKLYDCVEHDGAKLALELYQRFMAWAASLGVFGESHMSLDHKVQNHVDIKDQLLRLLDIMQRNLTYCTKSTC